MSSPATGVENLISYKFLASNSMQHSYFGYYRASKLVDKFLALTIRNSNLTLLCSQEPHTKPEY